MHSKVKLTVAVLLLGALVAHAGNPQLTTGTIEDLQVWSDGSVYVRLATWPDLCETATNKKHARLQMDFPGRGAEAYRAQLSLLTAAKLAGKQVTLVAQNATGSSPNSNGYCTLLTVDML